MAFGFNPKHEQEILLKDCTREEFLILAVETAKRLEWDIHYISNTGFIAYTNNRTFSWNREVTIKVMENSALLRSASTGSEMADWGKNKRVIEDFITIFERSKAELPKQELHNRYNAMQEHLSGMQEDLLQAPPPTAKEKIRNFFSIFKPVEGYFITPVIINVNVLIFLVMISTGINFLFPNGESLLRWGANFKPYTLEGEWWRMITSTFLHFGIIHLLMNMYALLNVAILLEPLLGAKKFATAYLLTALTASVTSLWWNDYGVSAGASGAVFGMYGVFLALLTTHLIEKTTRKALLTSIGVFIVYNLAFGLQLKIVDNSAHIGGLIGGILIGYAFVPALKSRENKRVEGISITIVTVVIVMAAIFACSKIPNDIVIYEKKMNLFSEREKTALAIYNLPDNAPRDTVLFRLKEQGIQKWRENIQLLDSVNRLKIPSNHKSQNDKLRAYCELRIKAYEWIYAAVWEDTDKYKDSIHFYNVQVEQKLNELNGNTKTD
ncbi:MAG: peptidase [Bacteroidetes bacterium]|jgi:rhomboid protease GluP|nr:peptidase [Bacteroidota bacterium]